VRREDVKRTVARGFCVAGLVLGAAGFATQPALAGGSTWEFDSDHYEPGARAFAWASIAWEHNPSLGTPEDGPYFAYISPTRPDSTDYAPPLDPGARQVAELQVSLEPYDAGGIRFGPHHATIEFVVPDLPQGHYSLEHCNSPCTTTLGDITFGSFTIGPVAVPPPALSPPSTPTTTTTTAAAPPTTTANPVVPAPSGDADSGPLIVAAGATALVGGLAGGAAYVRRRRARL
jgi:hypothetical protein